VRGISYPTPLKIVTAAVPLKLGNSYIASNRKLIGRNSIAGKTLEQNPIASSGFAGRPFHACTLGVNPLRQIRTSKSAISLFCFSPKRAWTDSAGSKKGFIKTYQ
jgi:hypothetical protein